MDTKMGKSFSERIGSGKLPFGFGMLFVLSFLISMNSIHIDPITSSLPAMALELGNHANATVRVSSAYFLGNMIGCIFIGPLSDLCGRKKTAVAGLSLAAAGSAICAVSGSLDFLVLGRVAMGAGASATLSSGRAISADAGDGKVPALILSLMQVGSGVLAVAMPLFGNAVAAHFEWRGVFWATIAVDVLLILGVVFFVKETSVRKVKKIWSTTLQEAKSCLRLPFLLSALAFGLGGAIFYCYISSASFIFQNNFGMSASDYAGLYAVMGVLLIVGAFICKYVTGRFDLNKVFALTVALQLAASGIVWLLFSLDAAGPWNIAVCFGLISLTTSVVVPVGTAVVLGRAGSAKGAAAALCGVAQFGLAWCCSTVLSRLSAVWDVGLSASTVMVSAATGSLVLFFVAGKAWKKNN